MRRYRYDEPNMSDGSLLVKLEDLIYMAMGPDTTNVVDFKIIQMILHILARQLRMLEQQVEIRFKDVQKMRETFSKREMSSEMKPVEEKIHGRAKARDAEKESDINRETTDTNVIGAQTAGEADSAAKHKGGEKKSKDSKSPRKGKKEGGKKIHGRGSLEASSSITIHEIERDRSKILVVDKGLAGSGRPRVGSVEVVTQSQFELLENEVKRMADNVGFFPNLALPDNEKMMNDLLQGNMTLPEAMKALQINARVQASERTIGRMAEIMTQLAANGVIPEELVRELKEAQKELAAAQGEAAVRGLRSRESSLQRTLDETGRRSPRRISQRDLSSLVTRPDLDEALRNLKADLTRSMQQLTSKASLIAEAAANTANTVAARMATATYLEGRMNEMQALVSDYGQQLNGFDAGLATQMQGFQDLMAQIRTDLKCGLDQLATAGESSEANAVKELTERYEDLVFELDHVNNTHQAIFKFQANLSDELRSLVEGVEMLRDQKADRDEIVDALRDKADMSRLSGLLTEEKFNDARVDLEQLFEGCHEKFRKQDKAWMSAVEDLMSSAETKVGHLELISEKVALQDQLEDLHDQLQRLEEQLGEPKAALLMRHLSRNAVCGACGEPALMQPSEELIPPEFPYAIPAKPLHSTHPLHTGQAALPPTSDAKPPPPTSKPCMTTVTDAAGDGGDVELLHRWCGGAHTVQAAGRQRAAPLLVEGLPTRRYDGVGTDGKEYKNSLVALLVVDSQELHCKHHMAASCQLHIYDLMYLMEEELQPCVQCSPSICACDSLVDADFQVPTIPQ